MAIFAPLMAGAAALGGEGGLSALLGQGLLWGVAVPAAGAGVNRLIEGSPESQMKRQMEIQREFDTQQQEEASALEGLMARRAAPTMSQLVGENALMQEVEKAAYKLKKARRARPQHLDELGDIVAGQHARIAALQAERTMTPLEIIQMMEAMGG